MSKELIDIANSLHTNPLFTQMDAYLTIKDTQSQWITGNKHAASILGYPSIDAMYLSNDYNMNIKASEYADRFIADDKQVILHKKPKKFIDVYQYADDLPRILLTSKQAIISPTSSDVIGTFAQARDLDSSILSRVNNSLINLLKNKKPQHTFEVCDIPLKSNLTEKEALILFYILQGYSCKYIAKFLHNSFRTIEYHIENIKNKFDCNTRDQIVEKAHSEGYGNTIPESLFTKIISA